MGGQHPLAHGRRQHGRHRRHRANHTAEEDMSEVFRGPRARVLMLLGAAIVMVPASARAQNSGSAPLSPGPTVRSYSPDQLGAVSSTSRYMITSAANDKGAFLWILDTIDRKVTLCEKPAGASDFNCSKKGTSIP